MQFDDLFGGTDEFYSFLADQLLPILNASYRIDANEIGVSRCVCNAHSVKQFCFHALVTPCLDGENASLRQISDNAVVC